ncbi:hypothetical protein AYI70_g320 [Smittium culicis]|uniref:Uncharacterized protein n=1 Tax=Smittium culicis TaxID=133412 RepID=A0A1R1YHR4_9FUNG|nr:hypothetical protein AYI70_g320 [Smittium culicis]
MRRLIIALQGTSKTSFIRPSMDISPIIEYFREIGDSEQLNIKSLTNHHNRRKAKAGHRSNKGETQGTPNH